MTAINPKHVINGLRKIEKSAKRHGVAFGGDIPIFKTVADILKKNGVKVADDANPKWMVEELRKIDKKWLRAN